MKAVYVNTLVPNETIIAEFLVTLKEIRQKKTGEPYLSLLLADRTGEVEAKMWDNVADVLTAFDRDDFVKVKGLAQLYQNKHQLTIHRIRRLEHHEVHPGDYFPCSNRDPEDMWMELQQIIASIGNPFLRKLLEAIFADEKTASLFKRAPAAKSIHHACLGGLIEHVLSLCGLCRMMATHYKTVDLDLLLSAAILHDIGKIEELSYQRSFSYTTAGQLVGHIVMGIQLVGQKIHDIPDFPPKLKLLLEHMILSHHGELQYGSPKVPVFPEALLFHHLDNLDSKFEAMRVAIERDRHPDNEFTAWVPALERSVLKKDRFLDDTPDAALAEEQPPPETPPTSPVVSTEKPIPRSEPPSTPKPQARPTPAGLFGEKLQAVLGTNDSKPKHNN
jgi:3'-5' exoribonuclease